MTAKITYTAIAPNGEQFTRTTATMPYTHVLLVAGKGESNFGPWSWHKSAAAAFEASRDGYHLENHEVKVVPAVPTAVKGKAEVGDFSAEHGWQEDAINALIEAKGSKKAMAEPVVAEQIAEPVTEPVTEPVAPEAAAPAKGEPVASSGPMTRDQKQALGTLVHRFARLALDELPAGVDPAEAASVIDKWLSYIPQVKTPQTQAA
jgi:hypothetical protein